MVACDSLPELCLSLHALETSGGIISRKYAPFTSPATATIRHLQSVLPESITKQYLALTLENLVCVEMRIIYAHKIKSLEGGPGSLKLGRLL